MLKGFHSLSKESIDFLVPISTTVPPEMWLKHVEIGMKQSLYKSLFDSLEEYYATTKTEYGNILDGKQFKKWLQKWPG